jgi:hypothetical protein
MGLILIAALSHHTGVEPLPKVDSIFIGPIELRRCHLERLLTGHAISPGAEVWLITHAQVSSGDLAAEQEEQAAKAPTQKPRIIG